MVIRVASGVKSVVVLIVKGFESVRGVINRLMTLQDPEILRSLNRHGAIATRNDGREKVWLQYMLTLYLDPISLYEETNNIIMNGYYNINF